MVIVQVLSYLPAATLMSCVGLLILEPAAARAASDMARFRGRLAEAHARTEVAGIEPVAIPQAVSRPTVDAAGAWMLGVVFLILLVGATPLNVWLLAGTAFPWALNSVGTALGEVPMPFSDEVIVIKEFHFYALLLSASLAVFGSAYAHGREARREARLLGQAASAGSSWWCQALLLGVIVFLVLFEVVVASLGAFHRSGTEDSAQAWQLAVVNGGLALITALAELVAGGWFLHRCLLPTVRTLSGGAKRVAAAGIRRTSRIEVIARPSLLTRLLAAIDAVIDPARRLDRFIASAWKVRRQRKGEVA